MNSQIAFSIDVEWAHPVVLADVVAELNARGVRATFFCTHANVIAEGHELAIHPNYRRYGNTMLEEQREILDAPNDVAFYEGVTRATLQYAPGAVGLRSHNLFWDSALAHISRRLGIRYVSNAFLPLAENLAVAQRLAGLAELPVYYMDHWDLVESATTLRVADLRVDRPGLKVFDFHPNLIYLNARTAADYEASRPYYHQPEKLAAMRAPGRGVRTLFLELLDHVAGQNPRVLAEIATAASDGVRR